MLRLDLAHSVGYKHIPSGRVLFAVIMIGDSYPNGSNRRAVSDKIIRFVHFLPSGALEETEKNKSARGSHRMPSVELT